MTSHLPAVGVALVLAAAMAGCVGDESPADTAGSEAPANATDADFPACEHPWPCADGSEWPSNITPTEEHPRQPPVLPDTVSMEDAEVVDRNPGNVTFRWTVTTETGADADTGVVGAPSYQRAELTVPAGLFLEWTIDFEPQDAEEFDGRDLDLRLKNAAGETVCATFYDHGERDPAACTTDVIGPRESPENWTIELEHELDRADETEIQVTVTARVAEPPETIGLDRLEHTYVESHDGTELEGWIYHPELPEGTEAPVVLVATPYIGVCNPGFNTFLVTEPSCNELPDESWAEHNRYVAPFVSNGYAVALFSTRGTGGSEGCFGQHSLEEQRDYAHLVDWLGERNWSNGRVAMYGLSYPGTTPFDAAIHQPEHLKTIVPAGIISDWYTFYVSPQGATHPYWGWREVKYDYTVSLSRPHQALWKDQDPTSVPVLAERACEEHVEHPSAQSSWVATDERPEDYFDERRIVDRFPDITTSVFVAHGLLDNGGHRQQEDHVWGALDQAPKRMLLGQWGHTYPRDPELLEGSPVGDDWAEDVLIPWMDFWLKGVGDPADLRLGTVDYDDTTGQWHDSTAWPPAERTRGALYLAGGSLATEAGSEPSSFRVTQDLFGECQDPVLSNYAGFISDPLQEPALLAGNPFLYLELEVDQPGGAFGVELLEAGPDVDACEELYSDATDLISYGAVDLRYHEGNFEGQDAPTDEVFPVRADLHNQAWRLEAGQRLAVLLTGQSISPWSDYRPKVTIHPESHVVLPTVDGGVGAELPGVDYPPRPFLPADGDAEASQGGVSS